MNRFWKWVVFPLGLHLTDLVAAIPFENLTGEAYTDAGQLVNGNDEGISVEEQFLTRFGTTLSAADTIQDKLQLRVSIGGIFWQPFPIGDFWQKSIKFIPVINEASSKFVFNDHWSMQGGYFTLKYNSPAKNLGEYLYRSESYPTYVTTGGWTWVDSAFTRSLGLRVLASHADGAFQHEAGLFLEYQNSPLYDITPAYTFSWKPHSGIEIGGGIALKRWFQPNIGTLPGDTLAATAGKYVEVANFPEVQNQATVEYTYTDGTGATVQGSGFAVWRPGQTVSQSALLSGLNNVQVRKVTMYQDGSPAGTRTGIQKFLLNTKYSDGTNDCRATPNPCQSYYSANGTLGVADNSGALVPNNTVQAIISKQQTISRRAINLMTQVQFDFQELLGLSDQTGPFKLYGELAVLGLQNQPVYYENIFHRMPIMLGLHVPTFGILDLLAVETEYLNNPFKDSEQNLSDHDTRKLGGTILPVPDLESEGYKLPRFETPSIHGDDVKWSMHLIKTLFPGLKLKLQVANDHLRLYSFEGFVSSSPEPQTVQKSQWYYMAHLQWGI